MDRRETKNMDRKQNSPVEIRQRCTREREGERKEGQGGMEEGPR